MDDILTSIKDTKTATQRNSIASLCRGIYHNPELRDWINSETVLLTPIPVQRLGEWGLISLLATPEKNEQGTGVYATPWAVIEWSLATMKVLKKLDLRDMKANNTLWKSKVIINQPADTSVSLTPQLRTLREDLLFSTLDLFCSSTSRNKEDFLDLAKHYSGLLPKEVYFYYHDLIPESKEWLVSDIPAILIEVVDYKEELVEHQEEMISLVQSDFQGTEISIEIPNDLTANLSGWFDRCEDIGDFLILEKKELGERMLNLLAAINKRRSLPGFRLVFVGEFSTGKSHLINRLLSRDILPESTLPTTATLISIVAGEEEQMEVRIRGKIEVRHLDEASWEDLLATDKVGFEKEILAGVRISLNHEWLRSLDVEIIDTPGAEDLSDQRANIVFDLLNQCDAAVLLVSATSPFSMTEAAFLEQEVIGRHVPRIIVVVSKLDLISPEEREKVMQSICYRIANVASNIPVLSTYPIGESRQEIDALATILAQIESLVAQGDRRIWRSRQVSEQLSDWLSQIIEISQGAISNMRMNTEERERFIRQFENEIESAELIWENLLIELDKRRLQHSKAISQKLANSKEAFIRNIEFEIQKTPDLKDWWEIDLPFQLRRELTILSRNSESSVLNFVAKDVEWLENALVNLFSISGNLQTLTQLENTEIGFELEHQNVTNLQRYRLLTRIGSSAAIVIGSILGGPIGIAASTGILLATEQYINSEIDVQREFFSDEINRVVNVVIDEYCQQISEGLRQLYQKIIDDTKSNQIAWKFTKKAALNVDIIDVSNQYRWQQLIEKAVILKQEIVSALSI